MQTAAYLLRVLLHIRSASQRCRHLRWVISALGTNRSNKEGQGLSALPPTLDVDLFSNGECVVDLDPKISSGALYLRVAEK